MTKAHWHEFRVSWVRQPGRMNSKRYRSAVYAARFVETLLRNERYPDTAPPEVTLHVRDIGPWRSIGELPKPTRPSRAKG